MFIGIFRFTHWFKQIPDFAVKTTENKMRKNRLQVASGCKQQREKHLPFPPCDTDRTQTCNLLIRSQMLYSVELRNQSFAFISELRVQRYGEYLKPPNFSGRNFPFSRFFSFFPTQGIQISLLNYTFAAIIRHSPDQPPAPRPSLPSLAWSWNTHTKSRIQPKNREK